MDLPKSKYYGVQCPMCEQVFYYQSQQRAELLCNISFTEYKKLIPKTVVEKGMMEDMPDLLHTEVGLVIGFIKPQGVSHICKI